MAPVGRLRARDGARRRIPLVPRPRAALRARAAFRAALRTKILLARAASLAALLALAGVASGEPAPKRRGHTIDIDYAGPASPPRLGPRLAPVTIEFFADVGDGFSTARLHRRLQELAARHPTRLRIFYRLSWRRAGSTRFLQTAQEAARQGRFFEFLELFYARDRSPPAADLGAIAARAGLDGRVFGLPARAEENEAAIAANHSRRLRLGIPGVPGLAVGGTAIADRSPSLEELEAHYQRAYRDALDLLDAGVAPGKLAARQHAAAAARIAARPLRLEAGEGLVPAALLSGGHGRGRRDAAAHLHLFCDLVSAPCRSALEAAAAVAESYSQTLRVVFHSLIPREPAKREEALAAAAAAECAASQGLFWPFAESLAAAAPARPSGPEFLTSLAEEVGLSSAGFQKCLEDGERRQRLLLRSERAESAGLTGAPTAVVGGLAHSGPLRFESLQILVERSLMAGPLARWASRPTLTRPPADPQR